MTDSATEIANTDTSDTTLYRRQTRHIELANDGGWTLRHRSQRQCGR